MRTIYLVIGQNDMDYEDYGWWNIQAFASKEDAEQFIVEKNEEYHRDMARKDELDDKWCEYGTISDEEKDEHRSIIEKWTNMVYHYDPETEWYIGEIQFQE